MRQEAMLGFLNTPALPTYLYTALGASMTHCCEKLSAHDTQPPTCRACRGKKAKERGPLKSRCTGLTGAHHTVGRYFTGG